MAFCLGQGGRAPSFDNVHHRLRLGEIQPAVQKGSFRKFAAAGRHGAAFQCQLQCFPKGFGGAVNLDFHHIFAGVGVGRLHVHRQSFVHLLFPFFHVAEVHMVGQGLCKTFDFFRMKQGIRHGNGIHAADTQDAYAPFAGGGGYGCNGCFFVHIKLLKENRLKFIYIVTEWDNIFTKEMESPKRAVGNDGHRNLRPRGRWRQAAYSHFKGANDRNAAPPCRHFDHSAAEQQNLTLPWQAA